MQRNRFLYQVTTSLLVLGLAIVTGLIGANRRSKDSPQSFVSARKASRIQASYGQLPLQFQANAGQWNEAIKFVAPGIGYTLSLGAHETVLSLHGVAPSRDDLNAWLPDNKVPHSEDSILRMRFLGDVSEPKVTGADELPGKANYFIGSDPIKWRTGVCTYAAVRYEHLYPGIDLLFHGHQQQLESDFVIAPFADPRAISWQIEGADRVELNAQGELVMHIGSAEITHRKPFTHQETNGVLTEIASAYVLKDRHQVAFQIGPYDVTKPLVIDPVLAYSTFIGSVGFDQGLGIGLDSAGNIYVAGETRSIDFPTTPDAFQTRYAGGSADVFVLKLDPLGTRLLYSTYLGGSGFDSTYGLQVDAAGNTYVGGRTASRNFPTTPGAFQPTFGGGNLDAFVAKFASDGALVYSTYLGGSGDEGPFVGGSTVGLSAIDAEGNAYMRGDTTSPDFPTTAGAFQTTLRGDVNAFVTKLNGDGSALIYSTYLGGSGTDRAFSVAVDSANCAYVTGSTSSTDFPVAQALQPDYGGGIFDAFVTKLSADGSALVFSTYLGGDGSDRGFGIRVDARVVTPTWRVSRHRPISRP